MIGVLDAEDQYSSSATGIRHEAAPQGRNKTSLNARLVPEDFETSIVKGCTSWPTEPMILELSG